MSLIEDFGLVYKPWCDMYELAVVTIKNWLMSIYRVQVWFHPVELDLVDIFEPDPVVYSQLSLF